MSDLAEPVYMAWARERFGKSGEAGAVGEARPAPGPGDRHPILAALPPEVRLALYRRGRLGEAAVGHAFRPGGGVLFVLSGAIGRFDGGTGICLGLSGPGSVCDVEALAQASAPWELRMLVAGAVLALDPADLADVLGRERADRLLIGQLLDQQAALAREATCNAVHLAPARLARWLLMLHQAAGGQEVHVTQAALADMLGVQRTSVNAAARSLQQGGAVRFVRGRVRIVDPSVLTRRACGCLKA